MSSSIFSLLQISLNYYAIPAITILGEIGNIFIVILFSRRRQNSCSTFLLWAAVMNNATITFSTIYNLYSWKRGDPALLSLAFCKLRFYIPQVCSQTARYLIVLACIDRFILTTNRADFSRVLNRPLVTRCLTGIVFIFWCIFLTYLFILITISNRQCGQFGVNYILYFVHVMIFICLLPLVLMAIFGFLVYRNIRRLHTRIQPIGNISDRNTRHLVTHRRDRELLIMVFAEVSVYMVTTLPYPISVLEIAVTNFVGVNKSIERLQVENFFATLSIALIYVNCSAPFYTYLAVSKAFRQNFKKLITKCECLAARRANAMQLQS